MPTLLLENVPEELVHQLEQLARRHQQATSAWAVVLLQDAVRREQETERSRVKAILERIRQNPIRPSPGTPDVVELLREDRNR
jgi:hypothetical protein